MTWEHDQLWCECDGATTQLDDDTFKCLQCGKVWRNLGGWSWEEVKPEEEAA